jgi:pimeloyl-ACP methyl ester carboxylesterase
MDTPSRSRGGSTGGTHSAAIASCFDRMLSTTGVRRRFVALPTCARVHLFEAGSGPAAVFLHGMNTSSLSWTPLLPYLDEIRMIAVDRPGRGLSDPWPRLPKAEIPAMAVQFVDQVLTELGLERPVLVGQSGGGIWSLWYALAHPERISGLVLLGSTPLLPGTRVPAPLKIASTPIVGDVLSRLLKPSAKALVRLLSSVGEGETIATYPELLEALVAGANDPVAAAADLAELRSLVNPLGYRRAMRFTVEQLQDLDVPTLLMWGDRDSVGSVAVVQRITQLLPGAHVEILPAGHVPQLGCPERAANLVATFARHPEHCVLARGGTKHGNHRQAPAATPARSSSRHRRRP